MCQACEDGNHHLCGMQTWCECDCDPEIILCDYDWHDEEKLKKKEEEHDEQFIEGS